MKTTIAAVLFSLTALASAADLPNPAFTPGATNPAVTQDTIKQTICRIGWTGTIRPSVGYTNKLKLTQMAQQGLQGSPRDYEEDHLISLELGGHPSDPRNLWPQRWVSPAGAGARMKDVLENSLNRQVCSGKITLAEAQHAISTDWIAAYHKYIALKKQKM